MKKKDNILLGAALLIALLISILSKPRKNIVEGFEHDGDDATNKDSKCENVSSYHVMNNKEIKIEIENDADTAEKCSEMCGKHTKNGSKGHCRSFSFNTENKKCKLQLYSNKDDNCLYIHNDSKKDNTHTHSHTHEKDDEKDNTTNDS